MSTPLHVVPRHRRPAGAIVAAAAVVLALVGCAAPAASVAPPVIPPSARDGAAESAAALTRADADAWLDGLVPAAIERAGIAGASVSIVKDGEILTARGFGTTDVDTAAAGEPNPVDPDETLFRVGSVSKVGTATAVMQLVESGDIDLDEDVSEYLDFEIPRSFDSPITMRTLLSHTAGFEEQARGIILPAGSDYDLRGYLSTEPPVQVFEPGTTPAYSNYGNALAGYIVQVVSGMPFEDYVDENVLRRAGMESSSFSQPLSDELAERLSNGYPAASQPALPFEIVAGGPAGALSATATDMGRFMLAQLGDLPPEQSVLQPETLDLMQRPALGSDTLGAFADGPRMTLGLFDESRNGHRIVGHGGDTQVFHAHMQAYPDDGVGIYVGLNSTGDPVANLTLRDDVTSGFADRYFPRDTADDGTGAAASADQTASLGSNTTESVADLTGTVQDTAAEHAALAAGTYSSARGGFSTFYAAFGLTGQTEVVPRPDGTVLVTPGPYSYTPTVFEEIQPWVWREVGGQDLLTMRVTDGAVDAIGSDSAFTLLRLDPTETASFALPVLGGSALVLLVGLIAWPVCAVIRRRRNRASSDGSRDAAASARGRVARTLTRVGAATALAALIGWVGVVSVISAFQTVPDAPLRVIQGLQLIGVAGIVPAVVSAVDAVRLRAGWRRVAGAVLTVLALGGIAWFAFAFRLLSPDVSY